ncbi:tyrosine-type recombinase/integrase [Scopulibacillus cellulosilyticus]|uniref:Tyrosine-type recombinase/integrase n=1 Tax=Scopulibacillus cellulosilyticus TaxID=2665665 RepID=A0ABW2Q223_9BACL
MHVEELYNEMSDKLNLENSTIAKTHTIIKAALEYTNERDIVKQNVAEKVKPPKHESAEMDYWTEEEVSNFLSVARGERLYYAFHLALMTGMNQSRLLGLRWKDIDLYKKTIHVRQVLNRKKKFTPPKTNNRKRSIALDDHTISFLSFLKSHHKTILKEKMKYRSQYKEHDLVICTRYGTPINYGNFNRIWERLRKKAIDEYGIKHIRFYDLRHTHATILLIQGVNPKIVAERLAILL